MRLQLFSPLLNDFICFQVFEAVELKFLFCWGIALCHWLFVTQCFQTSQWPHLQGSDVHLRIFFIEDKATTWSLNIRQQTANNGREKRYLMSELLKISCLNNEINPLNAELNPICYLLALLGAHHFLHVSRIRVKSLTLRLLMLYIYIYIYIWSINS